MNAQNPLIGSDAQETISKSSDALSALSILLASDNSDLCFLLEPIRAAVAYAASQLN